MYGLEASAHKMDLPLPCLSCLTPLLHVNSWRATQSTVHLLTFEAIILIPLA